MSNEAENVVDLKKPKKCTKSSMTLKPVDQYSRWEKATSNGFEIRVDDYDKPSHWYLSEEGIST